MISTGILSLISCCICSIFPLLTASNQSFVMVSILSVFPDSVTYNNSINEAQNVVVVVVVVLVVAVAVEELEAQNVTIV